LIRVRTRPQLGFTPVSLIRVRPSSRARRARSLARRRPTPTSLCLRRLALVGRSTLSGRRACATDAATGAHRHHTREVTFVVLDLVFVFAHFFSRRSTAFVRCAHGARSCVVCHPLSSRVSPASTTHPVRATFGSPERLLCFRRRVIGVTLVVASVVAQMGRSCGGTCAFARPGAACTFGRISSSFSEASFARPSSPLRLRSSSFHIAVTSVDLRTRRAVV